MYTDDRLNGTPFSHYRTKKTAAMAHLRILYRSIGLIGLVVCQKKKTIEMGVVVGVASKISYTICMPDYTKTTLLYRNPGSATGCRITTSKYVVIE